MRYGLGNSFASQSQSAANQPSLVVTSALPSDHNNSHNGNHNGSQLMDGWTREVCGSAVGQNELRGSNGRNSQRAMSALQKGSDGNSNGNTQLSSASNAAPNATSNAAPNTPTSSTVAIEASSSTLSPRPVPPSSSPSSADTVYRAVPGSRDTIIIHVNDESRGVKRDFECVRKTLLAHMKYFQSYITDNEKDDGANGSDIDISVHCDVFIFEVRTSPSGPVLRARINKDAGRPLPPPLFTPSPPFVHTYVRQFLVKYMHNPTPPPTFQSSTVVSILISSEFLQMSELTNSCLRYIARNIDDILRLPVDLSCISDALVAKLCKLCPGEVLLGCVDAKGKLLPRLYKKRLEVDFREKMHPSSTSDVTASTAATSTAAATAAAVWGGSNFGSGSSADRVNLVACRYCHCLYPEADVAREGCYTTCSSPGSAGTSPLSVDYRGSFVVRVCEPIDDWSLTQFVASLRKQGMRWEAIYWMLWAGMHTLKLHDGRVVSADTDTAGYCHKEKARFEINTTTNSVEQYGVYPCCGASAIRFNPYPTSSVSPASGCVPAPIQLAPVASEAPLCMITSSRVPGAARRFHNDEARVRVANKAKKAFGAGYGKKWGEQVKVAVEELQNRQLGGGAAGEKEEEGEAIIANATSSLPTKATGRDNWATVRRASGSAGGRPSSVPAGLKRSSSGSGMDKRVERDRVPPQVEGGDKGDAEDIMSRVCVQSIRYDEDVRKFAVFIAAPAIHRTAEVRRLAGEGGSNNRFVGPEGFVRFAAAAGVAVNPERYLYAVGGSGGQGAGEERRKEKRAAALNEPMRGLDEENRLTISKAMSSKTAQSMNSEKKTMWYMDCHKESDVERLSRMCGRLSTLRGGRDVGEKGASKTEAEKVPVRSRSEKQRGTTWRKGFPVDPQWNSSVTGML